jgi:hypothetical protein
MVKLWTGSRVIGVAGTAKNVGKTTATRALLEVSCRAGLSVGLTGIGYDGEALDNLTGLPKPRLQVEPGMLVATARRCLNAASAVLHPTADTGVVTPLGEVVVGLVDEPGLVVIVGPRTGEDVQRITGLMGQLGGQLILVDGAINRMIPLMKTDGLILSTGAARTTDVGLLAAETGAGNAVFRLPVAGRDKGQRPSARITLTRHERPPLQLPTGSLLVSSTVDQLCSLADRHTCQITVPGALSIACLRLLWQRLEGHPANVVLVMADPLRLLISGEPLVVQESLSQIPKGRLQVLRQLPLIAITVNPFYPRYRWRTRDYRPAYVDAVLLQERIAEAADVPVIDVKRQGGEALLDLVSKLV